MTEADFPPRLTGPRVEPDRPQTKIELNCVCGAVLDYATYLDSGLIKMVVTACQGCNRRSQKEGPR